MKHYTGDLLLVRGIPGAGKSTLAKKLTGGSGSDFFEADQYFVDKEGNYNFDANKLPQAHNRCREEVEFAMRKGHRGFSGIHRPNPLQTIVVSNTFTTEREMKPYYELAKIYNYRVTSIIVENRHEGQSIHNVPEEVIEKMKNRFHIKL